MLHSIPNPTKQFSVNFPSETVKKSLANLTSYLEKAEHTGYRVEHFDEVIGELRLLKTEFLSIGVRIIINTNPISETVTNISIEVQRVLGTFNESHEVTNANNHINVLSQGISSLLQNPNMDLNHKTFINFKKKKGITIFSIIKFIGILLLSFFILMILFATIFS
jgi:hypothetical protein